MTMLEELDSANFTAARHQAETIWNEHGNGKLPVDLLSIARALCLIHHGHPNLPALGVTFELDPVSSPGDMAFLYDENAPFFRKRWTIAHEIGHCCLGHVSSIGAPSSNLPSVMEQEANAFAGALLIPPSDLRKFAKGKKPTILQIQQRYLATKPMATVAIMSAKILNFIRA